MATNPEALEQALGGLLEAVQFGTQERALPLVHSLCVDFPIAKTVVMMKPETMLVYIKFFFPRLALKIAGQEAELAVKLASLQKRLKGYDNRL